jgi:colicin import membrane protein
MADTDASVEEEVTQAARLAFAVAAQSADRFTRLREDFARQAQHRSDTEYRQLEARLRGEAAVAGARLAVTGQPQWWDRADTTAVARMVELARQWRDTDPRAAVAADTITREVATRYGIDLDQPETAGPDLHAALARADNARTQAPGEAASTGRPVVDAARAVDAVRAANARDTRAAAPSVEVGSPAGQDEDAASDRGGMLRDRAANLELQALEHENRADQGGTARHTPDQLRAMASSDRAEAQIARAEAGTTTTAGGAREPVTGSVAAPGTTAPGYDSAARRQRTVAQLQRDQVPAEAIAVAMRADVAHARPAAEAVAATRSTVPQTAVARAASRGTQRSDRSR